MVGECLSRKYHLESSLSSYPIHFWVSFSWSIFSLFDAWFLLQALRNSVPALGKLPCRTAPWRSNACSASTRKNELPSMFQKPFIRSQMTEHGWCKCIHTYIYIYIYIYIRFHRFQMPKIHWQWSPNRLPPSQFPSRSAWFILVQDASGPHQAPLVALHGWNGAHQVAWHGWSQKVDERVASCQVRSDGVVDHHPENGVRWACAILLPTFPTFQKRTIKTFKDYPGWNLLRAGQSSMTSYDLQNVQSDRCELYELLHEPEPLPGPWRSRLSGCWTVRCCDMFFLRWVSDGPLKFSCSLQCPKHLHWKMISAAFSWLFLICKTWCPETHCPTNVPA